MDPLSPLAPIFAASVAVQQILEVFSGLVEKYVRESRKKAVLGIIGFLVGIMLTRAFHLDVMDYFKVNSGIPGIDTVVTALVLSAGTEGTNSIVKFLKYLKEDKKATAAETLQMLRRRAGAVTPPASPAAVSSDAKRTLEKLRIRAGVGGRSYTLVSVEDDASKAAVYSYISGK